MAQLPLFPLGTVLVPGATLPLQLFEPRYIELLSDLGSRAQRGSGGRLGHPATLEGRHVLHA